VRKASKGGFMRPFAFMWTEDEAERKSIETLRRRRPALAGRKARERRLGEIPAKVFVACPRRPKPKGVASVSCAKHTWAARDFEKAKTQELRPVQPARCFGKGYTDG
jgi:hypothetical protein